MRNSSRARCAAAALIAAFAFLSAVPAKAEALRIAYTSIAVVYGPLWLTKEAGLFKKHGIDADVKANASGPVVSRGLQTKEFDIAYVGFLPTFHDLARGLQVTVVAKSSYGLGSILVRKDSGVGSIKDLKGKKVAGSRKNSGNDVILRGFLLKELGGLDPEAAVRGTTSPLRTDRSAVRFLAAVPYEAAAARNGRSPRTGLLTRWARATAPLRNCIGRCSRVPQNSSPCPAWGKQRCSRLRPYSQPREISAIAMPTVTS